MWREHPCPRKIAGFQQNQPCVDGRASLFAPFYGKRERLLGGAALSELRRRTPMREALAADETAPRFSMSFVNCTSREAAESN